MRYKEFIKIYVKNEDFNIELGTHFIDIFTLEDHDKIFIKYFNREENMYYLKINDDDYYKDIIENMIKELLEKYNIILIVISHQIIN